MLSVKNVTKSYGKNKALDNVSISFDKGIYGILGPNGAGKTTLISIITNLLKADSGEVLYNGFNIKRMGTDYLTKFGYMPQYPMFYPNFTGLQMMEYMAALKGVKDKSIIEELLTFVNLQADKNKKVGAYSGGMKQRLGIATAMVHSPEILILDEPTAGLDPKERMRFRGAISEISKNTTVLISTHIISDIEYMANSVVLLGGGKVYEQDSPENLCKKLKGKVWNVTVDSEKDAEYIEENFLVSSISHSDSYKIRLISDEITDFSAEQTEPMLDDVFLYYFSDKRTVCDDCI